jgi:hypothetical protein
MKKTFTLTLALVLALSLLVACGGGNSNPPTTTPPPAAEQPAEDPGQTEEPGQAEEQPQAEPNAPDSQGTVTGGGRAVDSLISWMINGVFSFDYELVAEAEGTTTTISGSVAVQGETYSMSTITTVQGQTINALVIGRDGATYMVDHVNKFIIKSASTPAPIGFGATDNSGIVLVDSGVGEVNGRTLPYEEYGAPGTATSRFYLDGDQVYAIESGDGDAHVVMIITNPTQTVPAGAFDLPTGYTEVTSPQ